MLWGMKASCVIAQDFTGYTSDHVFFLICLKTVEPNSKPSVLKNHPITHRLEQNISVSVISLFSF